MDNENMKGFKRAASSALSRLGQFCMRHLMFFMTVAILCGMSVIFYYSIKGHIPATMDVNEWKNVSKIWVKHNDQRVSSNRVAIVFALFMPQVVAGAPFLNVTKVLCGYWFGFFKGLTICCSIEIMLSVFAFLLFSKVINTSEMAKDIAPYLENIHSWYNMFMLQLSSIPMHIKISVLSCKDITYFKFWTTFLLVTTVMSIKNVLIGNLLFYEKWVWLALAFGLALSALPMLVFICMMSQYNVYSSFIDLLLDRPRQLEEDQGIFSVGEYDSDEEPWLEPD